MDRGMKTKTATMRALALAILASMLGGGCELIAFADRSSIGGGAGADPSFELSAGVSNDASAGATCSEGGVACSSPAECATPASDCIVPTCDDGCCGTTTLGQGEVCVGGMCDGQGACVQCLMNENCNLPQPTKCIVNTCTAHQCGTGFAGEGKPCNDHGGVMCNGMGKCVQCNADVDCPGNACNDDKVCVPVTCADHTLDLGETDVDCGGDLCPPCADYKLCHQNSDCISKLCDSMSHTCGG